MERREASPGATGLDDLATAREARAEAITALDAVRRDAGGFVADQVAALRSDQSRQGDLLTEGLDTPAHLETVSDGIAANEYPAQQIVLKMRKHGRPDMVGIAAIDMIDDEVLGASFGPAWHRHLRKTRHHPRKRRSAISERVPSGMQ